MDAAFTSLPVLDLSLADSPSQRPILLQQLRDTLFQIGFLYIINHGVSTSTIDNLTSKLPLLFDLPVKQKNRLSKINSPHFLGYSGYANETTLGKQDLREQFDFATELPTVPESVLVPSIGAVGQDDIQQRDLSKSYWRLRGPNQWPPEELVPGFRKALIE